MSRKNRLAARKPCARLLEGFTLIELLVVIAIIMILMSLLAVVAPAVRERGRQSVCTNNLKEFLKCIEMYKNDFQDEYPPWLSNLYPKYTGEVKKIYACPSDTDKGLKGPIPSWSTGSQFEEAWDVAGKNTDPAQALRNSEIEGCSYLYEFNMSDCSWWDGGDYPDKYSAGNRDGKVSWKEVKIGVEQRGLQADGSYSTTEKWRGHVPIIRCFWHTEQKFGFQSVVLNAASGDLNVYRSGVGGSDWKNQGQ